MRPGCAIFQLWGLGEATSLLKASVSSVTPSEPCLEFSGLRLEQHEATLGEHAAQARVYVGSPLNSYQKFIISIVLGMVPSISLSFPASSQPLQSASWEGMLGIVHLFSGATHHLLQTAFPRLPYQLASCLAGPVGSAGRRVGGGEAGVFLPIRVCLVGDGRGGHFPSTGHSLSCV